MLSFLGINKIHLMDHRIHSYPLYTLIALTHPFPGTFPDSLSCWGGKTLELCPGLVTWLKIQGIAIWPRILSGIFKA